ncbi:hypothetical protein [Alcanivorax sp.]|uniref:hypothetical protein n=1 Tax=Alcanivorax sp. TaxID=1872427 RepID=UPI003A90F257
MSVELPDQREPVIEGRPDLFLNIIWFDGFQELVRQHNKLQATVASQQDQINDLISRVEALENP